MKQQSLASQVLFEKYGRKSRREVFLEEMVTCPHFSHISEVS